MTTVHLELRAEDGTVVETVEGSFEPDDLDLLRRFIQLMARVRETRLFGQGMPAIGNITFDSAGLKFTCQPYDNGDLHALLHVLRPVILHREATSFNNVAARMQRRFRSRRFSDHIALLRRIFEHGELNLFMQISINSQPLFDASVLDLWLNAEQYHTDADKSIAWQALEKSLTTENARALLMNQLQGKVKALLGLEQIANMVLAPAASVAG